MRASNWNSNRISQVSARNNFANELKSRAKIVTFFQDQGEFAFDAIHVNFVLVTA